MAKTIRGIFVDPPIAIARLGGSNTPQDAYRWVEPVNPRSDGNTVIDPWWTLDVLSDGSVEPRMPTHIHLRDGESIRPVAPFFEVWALLGNADDPPSKWEEVPLTPVLLRKFGADEKSLTISADAKNRKAARRMRDKALEFGTFPAVSIRADEHHVHTLLGTSPPAVKRPMISEGRSIPLGSLQVMRSRRQPKSRGFSWEDDVDVEVFRFRFTPGRGRFYGPPEAALDTDEHEAAVEAINAFLDPEAGWFNGVPGIPADAVIPGDTYDFRRSANPQPSLGVVDDTCEVRLEVKLQLAGRHPRELRAHANVFVGPPDFAPDRRPFLSLADELGDRGADAKVRNTKLTAAAREAWVEDLFERIYETVSLFNLDHFQNDGSVVLNPDQRRSTPIREGGLSTPRGHAMTDIDALRNQNYTIEPRTPEQPLPLSEHARTRHRLLQDIEGLREFVSENPKRLEKLIRQSFEIESPETLDNTTMRMPPFMRNSNAMPLTLANWQYELLMAWVKSVVDEKPKIVKPRVRRMSRAAKERRDAVLARL